MEKQNTTMKMESYGFLAEGATVGSVEVVGCCLFSKSRSFTACFLQTMLHKQAWLTWYLRKLNNGRAHCSLQTGNNCAIALPGRWCAALPSLPEWVQEFVTEEQFHFSAQPVWDQWKWGFGQCGGWGQPIDVILFDSSFVFLFRFVLVFSCLVLSVFSTIPAHQEFSSYCLLILVSTWKNVLLPGTLSNQLFNSLTSTIYPSIRVVHTVRPSMRLLHHLRGDLSFLARSAFSSKPVKEYAPKEFKNVCIILIRTASCLCINLYVYDEFWYLMFWHLLLSACVCVCVSSVRVVWSAGKLGNIFPGLNNTDSPSLSDNSISKLIKTKRADRRFSSCSFSYMFEHFNINFNFRWIIVLGSLSYWGYLRVWEFVEPVCVCFLWTWWKQSVTDCELVGACTTVVFMLALSQTARSDLRQFAAVWLF